MCDKYIPQVSSQTGGIPIDQWHAQIVVPMINGSRPLLGDEMVDVVLADSSVAQYEENSLGWGMGGCHVCACVCVCVCVCACVCVRVCVCVCV
jgi:hypothetical protein